MQYENQSPMMSAWFVFEKEYKNLPCMDWINY